MKEDAIDGACKKYWKYEIRAVVVKTERNTPYGAPTHRWKDNIKMDIR
jgi:hypothetical protein